MTTSTISTCCEHKHDSKAPIVDIAFNELVAAMQESLDDSLGERLGWNHGRVLLTTDVDGDHLWSLFISNLPPEKQAEHNCRQCRDFVRRWGGLVSVTEGGYLTSALWNAEDVHPDYTASVRAMRRAVVNAHVTGVAYQDRQRLQLNAPQVNGWDHMWASLRGRTHNMHNYPRHLTPGQAGAEAAQRYELLLRTSQYEPALYRAALSLLRSGKLWGAEKVEESALWMCNFAESYNRKLLRRRKENLVWVQAAIVPVGYANLGSNMLGYLLSELSTCNNMDQVVARFNEKMDPTRYRRAQSAPKAGTVVRAEKLVEQLGLAPSLERREATLADVLKFTWEPVVEADSATQGVFANVATRKKVSPRTGGAVSREELTMSWARFATQVLPTARKIELYVGSAPANYCGLLTAVHADAPPILQWDEDGNRNPVSWYVYTRGSVGSDWGLLWHGWKEIDGVTTLPPAWTSDAQHHRQGAILLMKGMHDEQRSGSALLPECYRQELHEVCDVIEAHSKISKVETREGSVGGLIIDAGVDQCPSGRQPRLRVTTDAGTILYTIDRWY